MFKLWKAKPARDIVVGDRMKVAGHLCTVESVTPPNPWNDLYQFKLTRQTLMSSTSDRVLIELPAHMPMQVLK